MQLEDIMLSKVSQVQKNKGHMFSLIWGYIYNTNTAILWKMGYAKGKSLNGRGKVKEGS
jgi:hypothetical protein